MRKDESKIRDKQRKARDDQNHKKEGSQCISRSWNGPNGFEAKCFRVADDPKIFEKLGGFVDFRLNC